MNIVFRVDASEEIGTGHVMRCLVLARDLIKVNAEVSFICRDLKGNLMDYIKDNGFTVYSLPALKDRKSSDKKSGDLDWHRICWRIDAHQTMNVIKKLFDKSWLIIDHYALDGKWERTLKPFVKKIMVIDDLADRGHECQVLLDQNLYKNMEVRYRHLISGTTKTLLGPKYLLLREEFRNLISTKKRNGKVNRLLISFGGSDPTNETMKVLRAVDSLGYPHLSVDVVIGFSNPKYSSIKRFCAHKPHLNIHYQIDYIAELMVNADLAIGAGGSSTWERCYAGLPTITIETAPNQSEILNYLSELKVIDHLGKSKEISEKDLINRLQYLIDRPDLVKEMSRKSQTLMEEVEIGAVAKLIAKEG